MYHYKNDLIIANPHFFVASSHNFQARLQSMDDAVDRTLCNASRTQFFVDGQIMPKSSIQSMNLGKLRHHYS